MLPALDTLFSSAAQGTSPIILTPDLAHGILMFLGGIQHIVLGTVTFDFP